MRAGEKIRKIRRIVLEEWRGLPDGDGRPERCVSVKDALSALLPKLGLADRIDEQQIRDVWANLVGPFLAAHSEPAALRKGTLTVQVLQPSVRYELERAWKSELLAKLRAKFPAIRAIRFS